MRNGDNLSAIFKRLGLSDQDMFRVLNSGEEAAVFDRLFPGYQLDFMMPTAGELTQLRVLISPLEGFMFTRKDQGYTVEPIVKVADLVKAFRAGTVSDSLFMAARRIFQEHIMEMANIFGGVIDFILDPRQGDQFSILYDEQYLDGEYIGHGAILAAQYINNDKYLLPFATLTRKVKPVIIRRKVKACETFCAALDVFESAQTLIRVGSTPFSIPFGHTKALTMLRRLAHRYAPPVMVL